MRKIVAVGFATSIGFVGSVGLGVLASCSDDPVPAVTDDAAPIDAAVPDTFVPAPSPEAAPEAAPPATIVKVVAGGSGTCVVASNGHVWCWGGNIAGELGRGSGTAPPSPTPAAVTAITDAVDVVAGEFSRCALRPGGALRCWGDNSYFELALPRAGDVPCNVHFGQGSCRPTPVDLPLPGPVKKLALGAHHACAIVTANGADRVYCWGKNTFGQLGHPPDGAGDGGASDTSCAPGGLAAPCNVSPTWVPVENPIAIAASADATAVVTASGAVVAWGSNLNGELGGGVSDALPHPTPTVVAGLDATALVSSGSSNHLCAFTKAPSLVCWGATEFGQLAIDTPPPSTPIDVTFVPPRVSLGAATTCGVYTGNAIACVGDNSEAQLGADPDASTSSSFPVTLPSLVDVAQVSAGRTHACVLDAKGDILCWGGNASAQLAQPLTVLMSPTPTKVEGIAP